jgi:hypothetical protein
MRMPKDISALHGLGDPRNSLWNNLFVGQDLCGPDTNVRSRRDLIYKNCVSSTKSRSSTRQQKTRSPRENLNKRTHFAETIYSF